MSWRLNWTQFAAVNVYQGEVKHKKTDHDDIQFYFARKSTLRVALKKDSQIKILALIYTFAFSYKKLCSCKEGNTTRGVYTIRPDSDEAFEVLCDHDTSGEG